METLFIYRNHSESKRIFFPFKFTTFLLQKSFSYELNIKYIKIRILATDDIFAIWNLSRLGVLIGRMNSPLTRSEIYRRTVLIGWRFGTDNYCEHGVRFQRIIEISAANKFLLHFLSYLYKQVWAMQQGNKQAVLVYVPV